MKNARDARGPLIFLHESVGRRHTDRRTDGRNSFVLATGAFVGLRTTRGLGAAEKCSFFLNLDRSRRAANYLSITKIHGREAFSADRLRESCEKRGASSETRPFEFCVIGMMGPSCQNTSIDD